MAVQKRAFIDEFLAAKRIAAVGVSRSEKHFSRQVFKEFVHRGYEVVPVNPGAHEIAGLRCFDSVQAVTPPPQAALVMTPASASAAVVEDCAAAGVLLVWLYRAVGQGSVSSAAIEAADRLGVRVIAGECPFMFFPGTAWFHGLHRGWRALTGTLPR